MKNKITIVLEVEGSHEDAQALCDLLREAIDDEVVNYQDTAHHLVEWPQPLELLNISFELE